MPRDNGLVPNHDYIRRNQCHLKTLAYSSSCIVAQNFVNIVGSAPARVCVGVVIDIGDTEKALICWLRIGKGHLEILRPLDSRDSLILALTQLPSPWY